MNETVVNSTPRIACTSEIVAGLPGCPVPQNLSLIHI